MMRTCLYNALHRRGQFRARVVLAGAILLLFGPLRQLSSGAPITQGEWARRMVAAIGVDSRAFPEYAQTSDYIEFLSGDTVAPVRVESVAAASLPPGAVITPDPAHPERRWLRTDTNGGAAVFKVQVPASGVYAIRALIGGDEQRWRVDRGEPRVTKPANDDSGEGKAGNPTRLLGYFLLARGEHEVSVELPASGAIARFDLVRQPFPHVKPPGGWRPDAPLTFGVKAVTMVQAMQLEGELPDIRRWEINREGEAFTEQGPVVVQTNDREPGKPSKDAWVHGASRGSWLDYQVKVRERCAYSLVARMTGRGSARWLVDDTVERHVTPPGDGSRFLWLPVSTLPLEKGLHRVRVWLAEGAGLDTFKLMCRGPEAQPSLLLLDDLGFEEGLPEDPVSTAVAQQNLDNTYFRGRIERLLASFFTLTGKEPTPLGGPLPWDQGILLPVSPPVNQPVSPFVPEGP